MNAIQLCEMLGFARSTERRFWGVQAASASSAQPPSTRAAAAVAPQWASSRWSAWKTESGFFFIIEGHRSVFLGCTISFCSLDSSDSLRDVVTERKIFFELQTYWYLTHTCLSKEAFIWRHARSFWCARVIGVCACALRACLIMRGFFHNVSYRYDYFLKYSLGYRLSLKAVNQRHTASPQYNVVLFTRDSLKKKIKALTARLRSTTGITI